MSVLVDSLKKQNAFLQDEVERFGRSVDSLSARLADALNRLREHDPVYVAQALGEAVPEPMMPAMDHLPPSQTDIHPD
ncbi:hypothetical protein RHIZ_02810 [Rhizobium skierniewicense]|uniref:hypothetical protein n=1 Tax=Rhizobium skierniewicense TaxID=984260 RepID=UPI001FADB5BB|nr:hypothetical protein [Rhizobium skierniewicense]MCI9864871.1 hypothetical protein [Rhizobium skierniewicense]